VNGDGEVGPLALNALVKGRVTVLGTHTITRVSQFLALSPVRGPWGHAGDAWFVDLGR
jgi:hypothetical protein